MIEQNDPIVCRPNWSMFVDQPFSALSVSPPMTGQLTLKAANNGSSCRPSLFCLPQTSDRRRDRKKASQIWCRPQPDRPPHQERPLFCVAERYQISGNEKRPVVFLGDYLRENERPREEIRMYREALAGRHIWSSLFCPDLIWRLQDNESRQLKKD